jgi:hypothetical protein
MPYIIWNRSCKRCHGQLTIEEAEEGVYLTCIQCAHSERVEEGEIPQLYLNPRPTHKKALVKTSSSV